MTDIKKFEVIIIGGSCAGLSAAMTLTGIFACGDNTNRMRSIANAVALGGMTGVMANMELIEEAF